jgi:ribosome-binding factor A
MADFKRTDRVADQIQKDLSVLIQREMKDPRVGMVTISSVVVSKDLHYATAYCTFLGIEETPESIKVALDVLENAAGFMRTQLAKGIRMRVMPKLRFKFDGSLLEGRKMSSLIEKAISREEQLNKEFGTDNEE